MQIDTGTEKLLASKADGIGRITFNNPERRNAMAVAMWEALPRAIADFEADPEVRVVVLNGAGGKAFVSGADISEFEKVRNTPEQVKEYEERSARATDRLLNCAKPTIAMIRGFCIGGGISLALCCDIRIASDGSKFGVPAARLGLGYKWDGVHRLVNLVGPSYAKEIFFTARQFSAGEASDMGLINRAVADDELEAYVEDYCARVAENAPLTMFAAKRSVDMLAEARGFDPEEANRLVRACFDSEDYREGRQAFMEKRKPVFRGV